MSKQALYILGILATILLGALLYPKLCCQDCNMENTENTAPVSIDKSLTANYIPFNLSGIDFKYNCSDNFRFLKNTFNNIQPVNDSINNGISLLKKYFRKNSKEKLLITGFALNSEKNTSAFPNLGLARANNIKNYFVSKGFAADRFETKGELRDAWKTSHDTILGAVNFEIRHYDNINTSNTEDWNALKEKINADPLILYFSPNETEINLSVEERQKIADLVHYLDNISYAKISCIGHTDGSGDRNVNIQLGQDRADFAKEYLIQNGIAENKIESSSKGPDEPVADNVTVEGKAKNRRTVVTLK
ncbi:OmpA family protein [Flavobacterium sp.]|uniref:OmpA family protein n=1 Tax=Flavobacterium sp. TaxID=239 RepID=UPI00262EAC74|nr:OmpA family protein [Flavobacterium sp.]